MNKEAKVHMLPTNGKDIAMLSKRVKDGMLQSANGPEGVANCNTMWQPQHLYITTDEEIKEGDWFYNGMNKIVVKATNRYSEMKNPIPHRKIIATTNTELHYNKVVEEDMHMYKESLPHIPQHIIEAYVKKPFDKVLVEYEMNVGNGLQGLAYRPFVNNMYNTIIIHPVEEKMYSKKDLLGFTIDNIDIIDWIKENL